MYLTNTVQDNTQLTRFHGLHRKKKLRKLRTQNSYSSTQHFCTRRKESLYTLFRLIFNIFFSPFISSSLLFFFFLQSSLVCQSGGADAEYSTENTETGNVTGPHFCSCLIFKARIMILLRQDTINKSLCWPILMFPFTYYATAGRGKLDFSLSESGVFLRLSPSLGVKRKDAKNPNQNQNKTLLHFLSGDEYFQNPWLATRPPIRISAFSIHRGKPD